MEWVHQMVLVVEHQYEMVWVHQMELVVEHQYEMVWVVGQVHQTE